MILCLIWSKWSFALPETIYFAIWKSLMLAIDLTHLYIMICGLSMFMPYNIYSWDCVYLTYSIFYLYLWWQILFILIIFVYSTICVWHRLYPLCFHPYLDGSLSYGPTNAYSCWPRMALPPFCNPRCSHFLPTILRHL